MRDIARDILWGLTKASLHATGYGIGLGLRVGIETANEVAYRYRKARYV